jgi:chemotaxis protein CheD
MSAAVAAARATPASPAPAIQDSRTGRRFYDATQAAWVVKILPGEYYATDDKEEVLVTVLGSCVSACIRDPVRQVGGMNHFMLVQNKSGASGAWGNELESARFGNFAMEKLINDLLKRGCQRERMEIKVFGGANVTSSRNEIGTENGDFVLRYLKAEGLPCAAQDLGGIYPRRIIYFPMTGKVVRRLLTGRDQDSALREESSYANTLSAPKATSNVELFR